MCLMINRTECGNVVSLNTGMMAPKKVNEGMPGERNWKSRGVVFIGPASL